MSDTERVLRLLRNHWPDPLTVRQLARALEMSPRAVQHAIAELRETEPICADGEGHWLATTAEEAEVQYRSMRDRMRTQAANAWRFRRVVRAMRAAEAGYGPQETLWKGAA